MHVIRSGGIAEIHAVLASRRCYGDLLECGEEMLIHLKLTGSLGLVFLFTALATTGCGSGVKAQVPLETAQDSVKLSLDEWKKAGNVTTLKSHTPPIEFYDDDWEKSAKLIEYELLKTYCEADGFPRCTVALVVQHNQQEPVRITVTYQVVMKPHIVIARDPFA